jgi:hypothetical protein
VLHSGVKSSSTPKIHVPCKTPNFYNFDLLAIDNGNTSFAGVNGSTMAPKDARRVPGTLVEVRAVVFMALSKCARRYGSNKTTKVLRGTIISSEKTSTSSGKTFQTLVTIQLDRRRLTLWKMNNEPFTMESFIYNNNNDNKPSDGGLRASNLAANDGIPAVPDSGLAFGREASLAKVSRRRRQRRQIG